VTDDVGQELVIIDQTPSTQLAPLEDPKGFVAGYTAMADELNEIIRTKNLSARIGQSNHVLVEGWCLLGAMLGVFPQTVWTRPVMEGDEKVGWEARVEARTRDGALVGAAEAECLRSERTWKSRDDYALRSMAQTRATSKALRQPLGFVVSLAGYNPTPAEEMQSDEPPPVSEFISDAQRRRLFAIAGENGVTEDGLRSYVEQLTGQTSTKQIPRDKYDALVELVEVPF
jgi:hypothetical protein